MSDPTVTAYLTKLLCSHGGQLERERLGVLLDLPVEQIEQILQDESHRFPQSSQLILAQSPLRICARYLYPNGPGGEEEDEEKCPNLHLCRHYLRGQCPPSRRPRCRFSHDVLSDHNRAVLKANELSGLNEYEIKVLLFQNDNQLLPEDCPKYVHGNCDKGEDCTRLHMCRFFTRGDCNRHFCKRSHNLLESKVILACSWLSQKTVENFQMLCELKHKKRLQELREKGNHEEARDAHRLARGRGRGRGRGRPTHRKRDGSQDVLEGRSKERTFDGPRFPFRSTSRPASQCSGGQDSGGEGYDDSSSESDKHSTNSDIRNDNIRRSCHTTMYSKPVFKMTDPTAAHIRPKPVIGCGDRPLSPSAVGPAKVPVTPSNTLLTSPMGTETRLSTENVLPKPSSAFNITKFVTEASSLLSTPDNIYPTSSSTSKISMWSTGEISYTVQPKKISESGGPLNPPVVGVPKVQATPSTTLVTPPIGASLKAETSIITDIASPKPSTAFNITENVSTKHSYIPDQKRITDFGKMENSPVTGPANDFPTYLSTSKTSVYFTKEDSNTTQPPKPVSSTDTMQLNSSSSPSNPPSSSSGSFRADTPSNKPYASVEPMTKCNVPSGNRYTLTRDENKAFNLAPKPTHVTTPQPQTSTNTPSAALKKESSDKTPEICLSNIWKFCKFGGKCANMHYYLPYRWQEFNGTDWEDLPHMEQIEKLYSDPNIVGYQSIDFQAMKLGTRRVRRLTTPSSVTQPSEYVLTTEWVWYWKDEFGTWTKYGELNKKKVSSSICSSDLENIYLSDPTGVIRFTAASQSYIINVQEMKQRNICYQTEKEVRRRPKFLDFENVKMLKGSTKSATRSLTQTSSNSLLKTLNYPVHWCTKAMPEIGYQKVSVLENSEEFSNILKMFSKTVSGHVVKKLWRVQNPSLWQVYQWQKDQMKKKNLGSNVDERQLFHGTDRANIDAICKDNFDWRICGTNGTVYGQGSYFARDASYSHNYSTPTPAGERTMFVARVLVGDFTLGDDKMRRPPQKYNRSESYDSCVDNTKVPSIFVVFEKLQVYPEYILEYEEQKKSACVIS